MVLVEAVNLIEAVSFGHQAQGQSCVRQQAYLTPCSEMDHVKQARIFLKEITWKNLVLQQVKSRGKYNLYQF